MGKQGKKFLSLITSLVMTGAILGCTFVNPQMAFAETNTRVNVTGSANISASTGIASS